VAPYRLGIEEEKKKVRERGDPLLLTGRGPGREEKPPSGILRSSREEVEKRELLPSLGRRGLGGGSGLKLVY